MPLKPSSLCQQERTFLLSGPSGGPEKSVHRDLDKIILFSSPQSVLPVPLMPFFVEPHLPLSRFFGFSFLIKSLTWKSEHEWSNPAPQMVLEDITNSTRIHTHTHTTHTHTHTHTHTLRKAHMLLEPWVLIQS